MGRCKTFSLTCISIGALFSLALSASADSEVHVQKITWVKPSQTIKAAEPTQSAPELLPASSANTTVRSQGKKALHPAMPKAEPKLTVPEEISAVSPLFPEKPPMHQLIASYYGLPKKDVEKAWRAFGDTDDALVALFMANASNADLDRIISLRQGNSWKDVIGFLQLDTKYLFENLQIGPIPKANTRNCMSYIQFMSWRAEPEFRDLGDLSVRELVGASLICNRFQTGPLEALRQVHERGSSLAALRLYTAD